MAGVATGSGLIGSIALGTVGQFNKRLDTCPDGIIDTVVVNIEFNLISTGAAFALVVDSNPPAASGVDDLDVVLNTIFNNWYYRLDESQYLFQTETPAQYRTVQMNLNLRDFDGTFTNGASVPVSSGASKKFTVEVQIPLALPVRFADGAIFGQGADRVRRGEFAVNLTGTTAVTLTNGSATISAVAVSLYTYGRQGDNSTIGKCWTAEYINNLQNSFERPPGVRVALLDQSPAPTNAVTDTGYTIEGQESNALVGPNQLASKYRNTIIPTGGQDVTQRATPLISIPLHSKASTMPVPAAPNIKAPGINSINIIDIYVVDAPTNVVQSIANQASGGGPVAEVHPAVGSQLPGSSIGTKAQAWAQSSFSTPAKAAAQGVSRSAVVHPSAAVAAQRMNLRSLSSSLSSLFKK